METVLEDHPIHQRNVGAQNRWSLVTGSLTLILEPSARYMWSAKTGGDASGLSRQVTLDYSNLHTITRYH